MAGGNTGRARRKRRRRAASKELNLSSSSSSSSDSDSSAQVAATTVPKYNGKAKDVEAVAPAELSDSSSSEESALFSSDEEPTAKRGRLAKKGKEPVTAPEPPVASTSTSQPRRGPSPSPPPEQPLRPPPLAPLSSRPPQLSYAPTFTVTASNPPPPAPSKDDLEFRSWYMDSLVSRFSTELDGLRKDPEMNKPAGKTRFAVLVEALASGADLFDGDGEWGASRKAAFDLHPKERPPRTGLKGLVLDALEVGKPAKTEVPVDAAEGDSDAEMAGGSDDSDEEGSSVESDDAMHE